MGGGVLIDISRLIRETRLNNGLTQDNLASLMFVSRQTISNWENGRSLPTYENIVLLSKTLNVPLSKFSQKESASFSYNPNDNNLQKLQYTDKGLWRTGLIVLLVISVFIPYAAPISLCIILLWKDKVKPTWFRRSFYFIVLLTGLEIIILLTVIGYFMFS